MVSQSFGLIQRPFFRQSAARMTIAATHAVIAAKEAAMRTGRRLYDTEHLLYGIAHTLDSPASRILAEHGASAQAIREHLGKLTSDLELNENEIEPSSTIIACMQNAMARLASMSRIMLDPEALLFELTSRGKHRASEILRTLGADVDRIHTKLEEHMHGKNT